MKRSIILTFFLVLILFSCNNVEKVSENESQTDNSFDKNITTKQLISLLENIDNQEYILLKLDSLDFFKKTDGIYISNESVDVNEPKHWIYITDMGAFSSVSVSTADKETWDKLLKELEEVSKPEPFDDETSDKTLRYVGKDYTFESYEPENGINLALNNLYQVYVLRTKK